MNVMAWRLNCQAIFLRQYMIDNQAHNRYQKEKSTSMCKKYTNKFGDFKI